MQKIKYLFFFLFLFLGFCQNIEAQDIPEAQKQTAVSELSKRGITEEEFRQRLLEKGIDMDNISPEQLAQLQPILEATLKELEAEKAAEKAEAEADYTESVTEQIDSLEKPLKTEEVSDTTDRLPESQIYGQEVFRNQKTSLFSTTGDVKPPDSYVLGTGDEISISIWGVSQGDFTFEISKAGYISPASLPRIFLKGISFGQAKELLRKRFSQYYVFQPEQFALSLNFARTITVNIFGEVFNYGSFSMSAINTVFNALVASGGPTDIGSLRNILLIRGDQKRTIDLYDFMLNPQNQFDIFLENNDIIYVPVADRLVNIQGAVKRPFWYELGEEENLMQLIGFAGGLNANAYLDNIQVTRIADSREILLDVNLRALAENKEDFLLHNGDSISVREIPKIVENFVKIAGAVEMPGAYQITTGMRVGNLLEKGRLKKEARTDVAFLLRTNPDQSLKLFKLNLDIIRDNPASEENVKLQPKDSLSVYSLERYTDKAFFSVTGAIRNPVKHPWDPGQNIMVQDAILLAGGLLPNATEFAYIIRTDITNSNNKEYLRINLRNALNNPESDDNVVLQPFDELNVLSSTDFSEISSVQISGAVRNPGEYQFDYSLNLRDILTLAGGFKLEAAPNRIDIFRVEIDKSQPTRTIVTSVEVNDDFQLLSNGDFPLQAYDQIVVRTVPEFEFQQMVTIYGEVKYPGDYALVDDNEKLLNLIRRAGGMSKEAFPEGTTILRSENNTGFLVTHLEEVLKNPNSKYNYILKAGDTINIPKSQDLVTLRLYGTKASELYPDKMLKEGKISVALSNGKNAKWYINNYAVGKTKKARNRLISVEHPNGQMQRTKSFLFIKKYPKPRKGSLVQIGLKPDKEKKEKDGSEPVDWEGIVANTLAQATAVVTLIVLIKTLQKDPQ